MRLKPVDKDAKILVPPHAKVLPVDGMDVQEPLSAFWRARLRDGSVCVAKAIVPPKVKLPSSRRERKEEIKEIVSNEE